MTQRGIDTHARVAVSKFYYVTNMQTKKTRAYLFRVSLGEMFAYFMI